MKAKSKKPKTKNLSADELFQPLHARLNKLLFYRDTVTRLTLEPPHALSIEIILTEAKRVKVIDLIRNINSVLEKIERIKAMGFKVVSDVTVEELRPQFGEYFAADEEEENFVKEGLYQSIRYELNYYGNELTTLLDKLNKTYSIDKNIPSELIKRFPAKTTFPKVPTGEVILDKKQTALLFHFLVEASIILNFDKAPLARIAHICTGHSEQNLRTTEGFGVLEKIMKDEVVNQKMKNGKNYNLNTVKKALLHVIAIIDIEVNRMNKIKKNL